MRSFLIGFVAFLALAPAAAALAQNATGEKGPLLCIQQFPCDEKGEVFKNIDPLCIQESDRAVCAILKAHTKEVEQLQKTIDKLNRKLKQAQKKRSATRS